MNRLISELVGYGLKQGLVVDDDKTYVINRLLELFGKTEFVWEIPEKIRAVHEILLDMTDYAGHISHPARQNHRLIPIQLTD